MVATGTTISTEGGGIDSANAGENNNNNDNISSRNNDATDNSTSGGVAGTTGSFAEKNGTISSRGSTSQNVLSKASYPIPQPLFQRLQLVCATIVGPPNPDTIGNTGRTIHTVPIQEALAQLVSNSIEAMDSMYFSAPPEVRKHPSFQHRLCIRVRANSENQTLTITDLGGGMTRADLINSLGIGKQCQQPEEEQSTQEMRQAMLSSQSSEDEEDESEEDDDDVTTTDEDDDDDDEDDNNNNNNNNCSNNNSRQQPQQKQKRSFAKQIPKVQQRRSKKELKPVSCLVSNLGGFYAAFCTLGVGVRVGTKSKFDDYYEFEIGSMTGDILGDKAFQEFNITRPLEKEGVELTVENGFHQFEDVRGESGTKVTIRLNEKSIAAGVLDESRLKPMFTKIIETTQYTVAFSSDAEEAKAIIAASDIEKRDISNLQKQLQQQQEGIGAGAGPIVELGMGQRKALDKNNSSQHNTVKERAKYIPLRLSLGERKMLRLVEAAMNCCDYTTVVDGRKFKSPARRTYEQLKGVTSVLRGLVTACDYAAGQKLLKASNYADYDKYFRQMFEIARRHKIMNPDKMRTEYGKAIYLLQDAVSPSVQPHLSFRMKAPIESVYKFLEERNGLALLSDKHIELATAEILAEKKIRSKIDYEIRQKERAVAHLKRTYRSSRLSADDIHLCLYSICDNNSFLNSNRVPIDKVIDFLKTHFSPTNIEEGYSLSIVSGKDGSRLSHSHERQYYFALQSLTLWRDIIDDMFRLWAMAEEDLLSETVTYSLQDTGQGLQRVQQSPRTYQAMQQILVRVQNKVSHWVGSNVIHLGDHNVPNALSFIDKYTQVPRILGPIVSCLENLERIYEEDDGIQEMIDTGYGGLEKLRKDILYDFFKSAFDGSGADNFYDAGSCIDGRLTSAWNWCSQLPEKSFYPIFKLTGFIGFDGEFK